MNLKTFGYVKEDPKRIFSLLGSKGLLNWIPDELYIRLQFRLAMGYWPDLKNPKTFNEKLQWLKLHDRNPLYTTLVDKYAVRQYIAETIGEEYLIPLVGGPWKNAGEIDFDALPEQFVLKCNHDSGGVIVCKDKSKLDVEAARAKLNKRLGLNYYYANREWPYKDVEPCIIAEKYMADANGELTDYKFFCFNGKADSVMVCIDRSIGEPKFYFLDRKWNLLRYNQRGKNAPEDFKLPQVDEIGEMFELANKLCSGMPFVRVDLYLVRGKIYFGELTFFSESGYDNLIVPESDLYLGDLLKL